MREMIRAAFPSGATGAERTCIFKRLVEHLSFRGAAWVVGGIDARDPTEVYWDAVQSVGDEVETALLDAVTKRLEAVGLLRLIASSTLVGESYELGRVLEDEGLGAHAHDLRSAIRSVPGLPSTDVLLAARRHLRRIAESGAVITDETRRRIESLCAAIDEALAG
jgi:hypothetical protein